MQWIPQSLFNFINAFFFVFFFIISDRSDKSLSSSNCLPGISTKWNALMCIVATDKV